MIGKATILPLSLWGYDMEFALSLRTPFCKIPIGFDNIEFDVQSGRITMKIDPEKVLDDMHAIAAESRRRYEESCDCCSNCGKPKR